MKFPIYAILENVRSLYNVGAIFRSSDGAGVKKIYLCGITPRPQRGGPAPVSDRSKSQRRGEADGKRAAEEGESRVEISKTALGAEKFVEWEYEEEACDVIARLKDEGMQIVGVEIAKGAENFWEAEFDFPVCFVFGHEVEGVSPEVLKMCDKKVFIPMFGKKESLNVEAAYCTVVYEAVRKFMMKKR